MNRETAAAITATNTGILIFLAAVLFALVNHPGLRTVGEPEPPWVLLAPEGEAPEGVDPALERGWAVYQAERCSSCHSTAGQGSPRYPLDGVGDRHSAEVLRYWVIDPQRADPDVRKRSFDHLSEDQVADLVTLLRSFTER